MTWTTLGTALENALASMMNDGEGAAATASNAGKLPKRTGTAAPAKFKGGVNTEGETTLQGPKLDTTQPATKAATSSAKGRGIDTTNPSRSPSGVVSRPVLLVIDGGGGGRRREGATSAAYRAQAGGGDPRRELLKLVVG